MKITITGVINYRPATFEGQPEFHFHMADMNDYGYVVVKEHSIEVEIPDDFDPRAKQIELLRKKEREIRAAFAKNITDIQREIGKLTAIEVAA